MMELVVQARRLSIAYIEDRTRQSEPRSISQELPPLSTPLGCVKPPLTKNLVPILAAISADQLKLDCPGKPHNRQLETGAVILKPTSLSFAIGQPSNPVEGVKLELYGRPYQFGCCRDEP